MNLARWVQDELENALSSRIAAICETLGIANVCLAGGVALNCVANRRILDARSIDSLFLQPACGDDGQSIGNALYGLHVIGGRTRGDELKSAALGADNPGALDRLLSLAESSGLLVRTADVPKQVAQLMMQGRLVALFQRRSEIGPRALGHRSIIAHPGRTDAHQRLSAVKSREWFRPYAPSILTERTSEFFELPCPSPFMLLVGRALDRAQLECPGVVHVDGTARIQTVGAEMERVFHSIISAFEAENGLPMVLNTSLNLAGDPLVETVDEALAILTNQDIDALAFGGSVLVAKVL